MKKENSTRHDREIYGKVKEKKIKNFIKEETRTFSLKKSFLEYDINQWLNNSKIRCKKSTYSSYQYIVNARIIPTFGKMRKKNITSEVIDQYTTQLLESGLLPKTVKDILIILQQILKTANIDIRITMPKIPKNEIQIFRREEQIKLEKALINDLNETSLGIYLCLYTGLRIGELCALKCKNIDIKNKKLNIKRTIIRVKNPISDSKNKTIVVIEEPKSFNSIREIPIPNFLIPLLIKICENKPSESFLITGTETFIETRTFFNKYKKILEQIDLDDYSFHALRHTFATRCIENGCDPKTLSEILGHSNVKVTLERYVHSNYENKVKMMNHLQPMYK